MRTPEEIYRYGKDVIEEYCNRLNPPHNNNGDIPEIIDENNQTFPNSDYYEWKEEVMDYIRKHEIDKIGRFITLFNLLESNRFYPGYIYKILGILYVSVGNLKSKEKGEGTNNPQKAQETNEPGPTGENPPNEKKKNNNRINWICIIAAFAALALAFYYYRIDIKTASAIATIIGAIFAVLSFFFK